MKIDLIIGNQYFLISDYSYSQNWNYGICTLLDYDDKRATIYKINTKTKVNVPTSQLFPVIKVIIVNELTYHKEGEIIDATIHCYEPWNKNCWYIDGYHYTLDVAISLAEYRENKINEILYEDN